MVNPVTTSNQWSFVVTCSNERSYIDFILSGTKIPFSYIGPPLGIGVLAWVFPSGAALTIGLNCRRCRLGPRSVLLIFNKDSSRFSRFGRRYVALPPSASDFILPCSVAPD